MSTLEEFESAYATIFAMRRFVDAAGKLNMHLTGSQFFGNVAPESDWDFFCEDCVV